MEIKYIKELSLEALLYVLFEWTYDKDPVLYTNLDEFFGSYECRRSVSNEEKEFIRNNETLKNPDVNDILLKALSKADHDEHLKFVWTFVSAGRNKRNLTAYPEQKENPFKWIVPFINGRKQELKAKGMYEWNRSENLNRTSNLRSVIQKMIDERNYNRIYLVEHNTVHDIADYSDFLFEIFLQYLLDENICTSYHETEFTYKSIFDHEEKIIKTSFKDEHFKQLIYISALDLKNIYDKHNLVMDEDALAIFDFIIKDADLGDYSTHDTGNKYYIYIK